VSEGLGNSRARRVGLGLIALSAFYALFGLTVGSGESLGLREAARGVGAFFGLGEPLPGHQQIILELHLWRVLVTLGVGAALALSGALLQGLFRNSLTSTSRS
jgi:ABC-type Fe3+-siderophore transport system permease subunit